MQLTGTKFTDETALAGNDLSTFPDFPAEIRAPAGTMAGVSGFQIHFSSHDIHTPADTVDLLIAFNPAALRANVEDVRSQGMVVINSDAFGKSALKKAGYADDPRSELSERYTLVEIPLTRLNRDALQGLSLTQREVDRCKNFFALGLLCWLYSRPTEATQRWLGQKFKGDVLEANLRTLKAGFAFGETTELFPVHYSIPSAKIESGTYRNITGNTALAWGILAAGQQLSMPVFLGAYPITPASDVLHEVSRHHEFGVKTFQAEDEIAAASATIGAAFAGQLGVTVSSGPGFILKQEALGLAVMVELPLVAINVQRAGPATGSPTKTEQGDLLTVLFGRHSQSAVPVLAASTPGDCFQTVLEAFKIATKYMTPVVVLSDGYLANSAEPWKIPDVASLERTDVHFATQDDFSDDEQFEPYRRDPQTLARPWAIPGTPGLEHRVGGLTKENITGNVVYTPENHQQMVDLRSQKIAAIADEIPPLEIDGPNSGKLLVIGWGGTRGAITAAVEEAQEDGLGVSQAHLRHLNPFPSNLGEVLRQFDRVLCPELNEGQLAMLLRSEFLVDVESFSKIAGQPFKVQEIRDRIEATLAKES
ncbi:MAG: 2-oxoglutarate ferredoxin oxidoreductase subunit alpha [Spirochaeta sp.]|nr:2-oxoglutarate ferredoxin oxidoreductase subunit alpha [Spirochaeta sp.]RPG12251.1 MAG: 2-oxoacid:acceptor oxidoreductase subunit alpha [Proteobacteria bacterium TMED72]